MIDGDDRGCWRVARPRAGRIGVLVVRVPGERRHCPVQRLFGGGLAVGEVLDLEVLDDAPSVRRCAGVPSRGTRQSAPSLV